MFIIIISSSKYSNLTNKRISSAVVSWEIILAIMLL